MSEEKNNSNAEILQKTSSAIEKSNVGVRSRSISDVFINRPVMTVLLALAAAFFGIYSYMAMPVNDLPGVDYPVIQVSVSYPGADPTIMGSNVASPLEQQFMQIPGIEMITSRNSFGSSSIILQFSLSKNIDAAALTCRARFSAPWEICLQTCLRLRLLLRTIRTICPFILYP